MIRPATTRVILGFDSSNSLQEVSFVKSTAVTDTDVSIERVHLALYDSYVVTGPSWMCAFSSMPMTGYLENR
jgi:hypothetical protein